MINLNMFDLYFKKCIAIYNDHEGDVEVSKEDQRLIETGIERSPISKYRSDFLKLCKYYSWEHFINIDKVEEILNEFKEYLYKVDDISFDKLRIRVGRLIRDISEGNFGQLLKFFHDIEEIINKLNIVDNNIINFYNQLKKEFIKLENDRAKILSSNKFRISIYNNDKSVKESEDVFGFKFNLFDEIVNLVYIDINDLVKSIKNLVSNINTFKTPAHKYIDKMHDVLSEIGYEDYFRVTGKFHAEDIKFPTHYLKALIEAMYKYKESLKDAKFKLMELEREIKIAIDNQ